MSKPNKLNYRGNSKVIAYLADCANWLLDNLSNVIANPSDTATDDLTKIQIGDTVYNVAGGSSAASDVSYDNTTSGLTADNAQEAIDEVQGNVEDMIPLSQKGVASGVAELDSNGKVPSSQLPSYVDDVVEYNSISSFPVIGVNGKIYVDLSTNLTYRWSGSEYVEISPSLALGESSATAYRGDRGKTAYDHSQTTGNPHGTTKSDIGLGNVPNVSTNDQTPTFTEASTRANIVSGETLATIMGKIKKFFTDLKTVAFTGSYNDLSNKPTIPTVNNATLTIQKNGSNVQTFTANQSTNATANITVPTKTSDLTNDSGYTTNTGTVTKVSTGNGLTGGDITTSGTIKTYVPRVIADSKRFVGGANSISWEEYNSGNNYNLPTNDYYHIISMQGEDFRYGTQLAMAMTNNNANGGVYYRRMANNSWSNWISLFTSDTLTNQNLNNIVIPGFYNAGGSNTVTNKPAGVDGFGLVVIHNAGGSYYVQICYPASANGIPYRRYCANGTWSSWVKDNYAGSSSPGGAATSANKLNTDAGSTSLPVYFSNGVPSAISTLGVANGGTGKTSGVDAANYLLNSLTTGNATPQANDYYIGQYAGGGTTNTTYHRRPVSALYDYIKSAASGTWGINVSGSSAKLSTARSIGLAGDFQGSTNFDGSAGISINSSFYNTYCSGENKANYPWHRIAKVENVTGNNQDKDCILFLRRTYSGGSFGIIKISFRTNNANDNTTCAARWIVRAGFEANDVYIARWGVTGQSCYCDVFLKCGTYPRTRVYQIMGGRGFSVVESNEVANTTSTDKKTSVEVYTSVESAATEIHGQAYTATYAASDQGTVNNAVTATKAIGDESGNNIKSTYIPLKTRSGIKDIGGEGTYSWGKIATLKVNSAYANNPVAFELSQRGEPVSLVQVSFKNENNTDPALGYFITDNSKEYYIKKTATSTWELYAKYKDGVYGSVSLHRIYGYGYNNKILVTVNMENISAPTGTTQVVYGGNVGYATTAGSATDSTKLPLAGGTMTGTINSMDIKPKASGSYSLGNDSFRFSDVWAGHFKASTALALRMSSGYYYSVVQQSSSITVTYGSASGSSKTGEAIIFGSANYLTALYGNAIKLYSLLGVETNNSIYNSSDEKVKVFSNDIESDEEKLVQLFDEINICSYKYKYSNYRSLDIGINAQELESSLDKIGINPDKYNFLNRRFNHFIDRSSEEDDRKFYLSFYSIDYSELHNLSLLKIKHMEKEHKEDMQRMEDRLTALEKILLKEDNR